MLDWSFIGFIVLSGIKRVREPLHFGRFSKSESLKFERRSGVGKSSQDAQITWSVSFVGPARAAGKTIKIAGEE
jgi:hypothetical protein